ncbi:MFS transporter [Lacrimispora xylanolytica]|uniref:MFS transporter n=1 Tax=Lacrimispora xylanolytica TaxID=29375 RepID=A0ABY7A726_9FIRM|nr:MFS transporter [Lacrimispora xylanolytica]WAJ22118.1 MFS transporter [Lacrimispora xylanolytica]
MKTDKYNHIFLRCCYGYAVSGMAVLVIGAILPSIITEAGISFLAAGSLLSGMAIGNLSASFLFPVLVSWLGRKRAIFFITLCAPVCLFILSILPPFPIMYGVMLIYGLVRGSITILNNSAVNDIYGSKATGKLNLLHCFFAVGAFLAPFLTAVLMKLGFNWRHVLYLILILTAATAALYGTMDDTLLNETSNRINKDKGKKDSQDRSFLKSYSFYGIAFILFFYLGLENCINGWFVTYLQNTNVMSATYATALVSFTWLVIMAGRLICAALSKKLDKSTIILILSLGSAACFFLLISTKNLTLITAALLGLGFFLSGIYPTCIANAGPMIKGSTLGMSVLTAISAMGGIITPQIIGGIADRIGIVGSIGVLNINVFMVIFLSFLNFRNHHKKK